MSNQQLPDLDTDTSQSEFTPLPELESERDTDASEWGVDDVYADVADNEPDSEPAPAPTPEAPAPSVTVQEPESSPLGGGRLDIDEILSAAIDQGASDVHISPDDNVAFTVRKDIMRKPQYGVVDPDTTNALTDKIITSVSELKFVENLELDTSYSIREGRHKGRRTRLSVGKSFNANILTFRIIADSIPTPEQLGIGDALLKWSTLPHGLVMMNGPTGTGKALTLDTPLPTPSGVRRMGDIAHGDTLYDSYGNTCSVTALYPVNNTPELYAITFSNGATVHADAHHQWLASTSRSRDTSTQWHHHRAQQRQNAQVLVMNNDVTRMTVPEAFAALQRMHVLDDDDTSVDALATCIPVNADGTTSLSEACIAYGQHILERYPYDQDERIMCMTTRDVVVALNEGQDVWIPRWGRHGDWAVCSVDRIPSDDARYQPVRCLAVDSPDHSYVCDQEIVTHNSTTLASLVRKAQLERPQKIVTVEDPVEYVFGTDGRALVWQREVGLDTHSFSESLDSFMRMNPDIIMVGEVRNRYEVDQLLRASETGHLTISTMHTNSAPTTVNRIMGLYQEQSEQRRVLSTLAENVQGLANQVLVRTKDGQSMFAIREILESTREVSDMIEKGDVRGLRDYQVENHMTMDDGLAKAVIDNRCTRDEARMQSSHPSFFDELLDKQG